MPHIKTYDRYYKNKQFIIYAICFSFGKQIYVGKTLKHAVKSHYKDHYILRYSLTKDLFETAKSTCVIPKMYLLENLETTEVMAYRHCVAWIKYFMEHGFECIAYEGTKAAAENLLEESKDIYEKIRSIPEHEVLQEDKVLVSNIREYRKKTASETDSEYCFIGFRATKQDAEKIQVAANKLQRSVSEYCRAAAVDGCIVNVDYNFLWKYMEELVRVNRLLEQMIYTIYETQSYQPQDIANIQKKVDAVVEQQRKINEDMIAIMKKTQKEIRAARRYLK